MIINAIIYTFLSLLVLGFMMLFVAYFVYFSLTGSSSIINFLKAIIHPIATLKRNENSIINTIKWFVYLLIFLLLIGFIGDNWSYIASVFGVIGQIVGVIFIFIFLAFIVAQFIKLVIYFLHEK